MRKKKSQPAPIKGKIPPPIVPINPPPLNLSQEALATLRARPIAASAPQPTPTPTSPPVTPNVNRPATLSYPPPENAPTEYGSLLPPNEPTQTPAKDNPAPVAPLAIIPEDPKLILRKRISEMFRATPGQSASEIARRIQKREETLRMIDKLPDIQSDEGDMIYQQFVAELTETPMPIMEYSPETRQALLEQFVEPPAPVFMEHRHIDQSQLAAAAGYTVASLFTGRFDPQIANRVIQQTIAQANQRAMLENEQNRIQYENRKQRMAELFGIMKSQDELSFQQRGYEARDQRMADRNAINQNLITERAALNADSKERNTWLNNISDAIAKNEPERVAALIDLYQTRYPDDPIPQSILNLAPTTQQQLQAKQVERVDAQIGLLEETMEGMQLKNELTRITMPDVVAQVKDKGKLTRAQLQKVIAEVDNLPAYIGAKTRSLMARAKAAELNAQTAYANAQTRSAKTQNETAILSTYKERMQSNNTLLDNLRQALDKAEDEFQRATRAVNIFSIDPTIKTRTLDEYNRRQDAQESAARRKVQLEEQYQKALEDQKQIHEMILGGNK